MGISRRNVYVGRYRFICSAAVSPMGHQRSIKAASVMKHIRTIETADRVCYNGRMVFAAVCCEEYATFWAFTCKIAGHALPCALGWKYKKAALNATYDNAKQEFLHDVSKRYN